MSDARTRIDKQVQQNRYDALEARYGHLLKVNEEMAETIATLKDRDEPAILPEIDRLKMENYRLKSEVIEKAQEIGRIVQSKVRMYEKLIKVRKIIDGPLTK